MATNFKFPDLGEGVTEGEIKKWLVKVGDDVRADQSLAEVETDKAVVEMPSPASGKVLKLYHNEGDIVKVGEVLATIGSPEEKPLVAMPEASAVGQGEAKRVSVSVVGELPEGNVVVSSRPVEAAAEPGVLQALPAVRKLAQDLNVDLVAIKGTGPGGRITDADVKAAAAPRLQAPRKVAKFDLYGYVDRVPLRGVRRTTAKRMLDSTLQVAAVSMMEDADVTDLWALRDRVKAIALEQRKVKLTFLPFIIKAVTMALKNNLILNSSLDDANEEIVVKKYFNIGVAVATDDGLLVPVIKAADSKEFLDMAEEIDQLIEKAKARTLDLADLKGGTFTITNYGSLGGTYGTPIVNYPEAAILGVGRIRDMPWVVDGKVEVRKILPLSLTWDHRILDGAQAARFVNELVRYLEKPDIITALH